MMIVVMVMMMTAVMVMMMTDLREYGEDNSGSPSSPDQKWRVEEEDCERFSELPVNRDDIGHIGYIFFNDLSKDIFPSMICVCPKLSKSDWAQLDPGWHNLWGYR